MPVVRNMPTQVVTLGNVPVCGMVKNATSHVQRYRRLCTCECVARARSYRNHKNEFVSTYCTVVESIIDHVCGRETA